MPHLTEDANPVSQGARAARLSAHGENDTAAAYRELLHGAGSAVCVLVLGLALLVAIFF